MKGNQELPPSSDRESSTSSPDPRANTSTQGKKRQLWTVVLSFALLLLLTGGAFYFCYPPLQVAKATVATQNKILAEWAELQESLPFYQHIMDFPTEQYYMKLQLPSTEQNISDYEIYSDYGDEKLKILFDFKDSKAFCFVSADSITLETPALSKVYGINVHTFAQDWNKAFFTTTKLPEDKNYNIFQRNPLLSKELIELSLTHLLPLANQVEVEKLEKQTVLLQEESHSLPTYSLHIPPETLQTTLDSLFSAIFSSETYSQELLQFLNTTSPLQGNQITWTEENLQANLNSILDNWLNSYENTEKSDINISIYKNKIVRLNVGVQENPFTLQFDNPDNLLQSITLHSQGNTINTSIFLTEDKLKFIYSSQEGQLFALEFDFKETAENLHLHYREEPLGTWGVDVTESDKVSIIFPDSTKIYMEKQIFSDHWFPQSTEYEDFFSLGLFEFMLLFGGLFS